MFRNSITLRTSLLFTLLAAGVFLIMGLVIRASATNHFNEQDQNILNGKLELIQHILSSIQSPSDYQKAREQLANALVGHHDLVVQVSRESGDSFFSAGNTRVPEFILRQAFTADQNHPTSLLSWASDSNVGYRSIVVTIPLRMANAADKSEQPTFFIVAIATETANHETFLLSFERQLLLVGGGGLLLIATLGWFVTKRGMNPIQTMAQVAEGISAQRLNNRLQTNQFPIELRPLANAFNEMLDRLGESLHRLNDFSSDLAHELRTPINNLMTQTQVSLTKPRNISEYKEILYSNLEEYERLARMIADMLFLAKADHGLVIPHRERVDILAEVNALFEFYDALAAEKEIGLSVEGSGVIAGDGLMIRRALSNLLSNAIRHATPGTQVKISLSLFDDTLTVTVVNQGANIPAMQLSRVFDRFYRADASRQRGDEGAGLGLAITKSIIEAHDGAIIVQSEQGLTRFIITLHAFGPKSATYHA